MANKKKSFEASIKEMRSALVGHILDGNDDEMEEVAIKGYVGSMSEDVLRGHYATAIVRPAERIKVIVDCLRRCAKDESAAGDKFIESLPGDWGNKDLNQLADDLCSGDLVIEEACEDALPEEDGQDRLGREVQVREAGGVGLRGPRLRRRIPLCPGGNQPGRRGSLLRIQGLRHRKRLPGGGDRVVQQHEPEQQDHHRQV